MYRAITRPLQLPKQKFGEIDYTINPKIFEKIQETPKSEVTFYLISEIENYFIEQIKRYTNIFKNIIIRN